MTQSKVDFKGTVKVNKTNLYNLVKAKSPFALPKMRYTHYEHYRSAHWLTYTSDGSKYVRCSFGSSYGAFFLRVEAVGYDEVFELSFDDLVSFGLIKDLSPEPTEQATSEQVPVEEVKSTDYVALDHVVLVDKLSKGITLSEYVKLKGLTEENWLLIKDFNNNKLITGVRADGLTSYEEDYYVVTVENYIFPQYIKQSERGYYIVIYISKTPTNLVPTVYTETELPAEVIALIDNPTQLAKDKDGNRYAKCTICGKVDNVENFAVYGGSEHCNRGKCMECVRANGSMVYIEY